jgi:hypothetical protein
MASERTSRHALFGVSAPLFAASAAVTIGDGCRGSSHHRRTPRTGQMVAALEGGYNLKALADSGREVIDKLGRAADEPIAPAPTSGDAARGAAGHGARILPIIQRAHYFHAPFWQFT